MSSDTQNPSKAEPIFREALQCSSVQVREEFLAAKCRNDTALLAEVRAMIRDHFAADNDPSDATMLVTPSPWVDASGGENVGDSIGRYTLLHLLGEGGFGSVWAAEQSEPVRREVALKIVKLGMDTREVIARFEQERQALAMMDHPNIAKVLDGGATPSGRPYFVMELVKGEQITSFCDQQRLSMPERLRLFVQVCHAVQHAHQKGIIHRDLKPSNILVSLGDDGRCVPHVIDFGIAKAVTPLSADASLLTQVDQFIGTPTYMSPEQAGLGQGDIDTRSDIYSLGVLLYELLTGMPPFDPQKLRGYGLEEMRRRIREEEPSRPSTRLATVDEARRLDIAASRRANLPKLVHSMRGDLDWVVMKSLEKDRTRRYDSANSLAHDLERYLRQEPVTARPPNVAYVVGKFVRRNQGPVAAAAAIVLLILAGLMSSTLLYLREKTARAQAESAERTAITQGKRSAQFATFMQQIFDGITPEQAKGQDTKLLKKILDSASQRIGQELREYPDVEAELRNTIGRVYQSVSLHGEALPHLQGALELRRRVLGEEHPDTLASMNTLGTLYREQGKLKNAESLYTKAVEVQRRVLGEEHPATLASMSNLAELYSTQGRRKEAETLMTQTLEVNRRMLGNEHYSTVGSMNNLALLYQSQGRLTEAETLMTQTLEVLRRMVGEEHPDTLTSMNNLARLHYAQGELKEAESLFTRALELSRRIQGEEHSNTLNMMNNLASLYSTLRKRAEAEALFTKSLEIHRRTLGEDHPITLALMGNLGSLYHDQGKLKDAELLLTKTLEANGRVLGEEHPNTLTSMSFLAGLYHSQGRLEEAEQLHAKTLQVRRRVLGEEDPATLASMNNLARLYDAQGRLTEAEQLHTKTLEASRRVLGKDHPKTLTSLNNLALVLRDQKKWAEAEPLFAEEMELRRRPGGKQNASFASAAANLGVVRSNMKKHAEAEAPLREALSLRQELMPDNWRRFSSESLLGFVLLNLKKLDEAAPLLRSSYEGLKARLATIPAASKVELIHAAERLAALAKAKGDETAAGQLTAEAEHLRQQISKQSEPKK